MTLCGPWGRKCANKDPIFEILSPRADRNEYVESECIDTPTCSALTECKILHIEEKKHDLFNAFYPMTMSFTPMSAREETCCNKTYTQTSSGASHRNLGLCNATAMCSYQKIDDAGYKVS